MRLIVPKFSHLRRGQRALLAAACVALIVEPTSAQRNGYNNANAARRTAAQAAATYAPRFAAGSRSTYQVRGVPFAASSRSERKPERAAGVAWQQSRLSAAAASRSGFGGGRRGPALVLPGASGIAHGARQPHFPSTAVPKAGLMPALNPSVGFGAPHGKNSSADKHAESLPSSSRHTKGRSQDTGASSVGPLMSFSPIGGQHHRSSGRKRGRSSGQTFGALPGAAHNRTFFEHSNRSRRRDQSQNGHHDSTSNMISR